MLRGSETELRSEPTFACIDPIADIHGDLRSLELKPLVNHHLRHKPRIDFIGQRRSTASVIVETAALVEARPAASGGNSGEQGFVQVVRRAARPPATGGKHMPAF